MSMSIVTATKGNVTFLRGGITAEVHLVNPNPNLCEATLEQLLELAPLVSALADGQTDLGELAQVAAELPIVKALGGLGL